MIRVRVAFSFLASASHLVTCVQDEPPFVVRCKSTPPQITWLGFVGMHGDRVAIRHLSFAAERGTRNVNPLGAAIPASEHSKNHVGALTALITGNRVHHVWV